MMEKGYYCAVYVQKMSVCKKQEQEIAHIKRKRKERQYYMTYLIYFSPTGGTLKAAEAISDPWMPDIKKIDLTDAGADYSRYQFSSDDICIIAVPSYGGRVPDAAVKRLSKMHAEGARTAAVAVYGNRDYDDTLLELKDTLVKAGFQIDGLITAIAQHSIACQVAAGRPDSQDIIELKSFGRDLKKHWESGKASAELTPKGNYPYREYNGVPLKPKAIGKCTACEVCAEKCPVGAIPRDNPKYTNKNLCISCMRCIRICPSQARKVNSLILKGAESKLEKSCKARKNNTCVI